ncbi:hypothetical protein LSTR_LSTR013347 [Laodelphax striatellus]|uniref:SUZ domain-containing protein n=1 Tax=Laodelphax striatellus TaxID=195883 RepID=A0A482XBB4_LAOST|nr:hypothetical protein LSTR_LSTR013347 [Laodelphax striatellus]
MEIGDGFQMHIFNMATGTEVEELESWEDLTDEILERNLAKMKTITTTEKPDVDQNATTVLLDSNDIRSRFLNQHTAPAVKILKRPNAAAQSQTQRLSHATGDMSPCVNGEARPQRKSLQQREMEYAEARLRILGQAHCPEEKELTFQERSIQSLERPKTRSIHQRR